MNETDDDVGHLDAGIVDVVLNFNVPSGGAQHANEGIAENGVAQVADVRGLVGIDVGVLDNHLAFVMFRIFGLGGGEQRRSVVAAVQTNVQVSVAGDLDGCDAINGRGVRQFL